MSHSDICSHIVAYLELCVTLAYSERTIFRILAYSEPEIYPELYQSIFWHIQNAV